MFQHNLNKQKTSILTVPWFNFCARLYFLAVITLGCEYHPLSSLRHFLQVLIYAFNLKLIHNCSMLYWITLELVTSPSCPQPNSTAAWTLSFLVSNKHAPISPTNHLASIQTIQTDWTGASSLSIKLQPVCGILLPVIKY